MFEQNPSKWTPAFFDEMRKTGDVYGDQVADEIFKQGALGSVNKVLVSLINNAQPVPEELPQVVHDYFENTAELPVWTDYELVRQGEDFFTDYSLMAFSILGCGSLPACYSGAIGAKVLAITGQLEDHINRRVVETIFLMVDILSEGGLTGEGRGIRATQKVRLMHAAIRHLILCEDTPPATQAQPTFADVLGRLTWNLAEDGYPVNQETMGFTYLTFTYVIIKSLKKLGVTVSEDQERAYFHCWNVVSKVLGVNETFFCTNMQDAETLWNILYPRLRKASPEGVELTRVLMAYMGEQIKTGSFFGRFMPYRHIPKWLTRELLGRETAELLGIRWHLFDRIGMWFTTLSMHLLGWFESKVYADLPFGHRVAEWIFRQLAKAEHKRIGDRPEFQIPDHLKETLAET